MTGTTSLLRELADRAELADLVARHSLWIDEGRYDRTDELFTDDVVVTTARGEVRGVEALVEAARTRHASYAGTLHSKANVVVDLDGARASVRANDVAVYLLDDATEAVAAAIHRYGARRTERGWRFDRLEVTPVALTAALDRAAVPGAAHPA